MPASRVASTIDAGLPLAQQKPTVSVGPIRPTRITEADVGKPDILAKQMNALHLEVAQATQAVRAHPEQAPVTFKNVVCGTAGAKLYLQHNFGRFADFVTVKWAGSGTTTAPILVSDELDGATANTSANILVLRSYVAGTATIRLFPGA